MSTDSPLITIGITCFREGEWLLECWGSVLSQTDDRWCAVLVMDGEADARTREIYAQLDHPKLKKFAMPSNVGPYPTRNKAFELTETPYHFYLDGDDQLVPDSVRLVLEAFADQPDAGFVYGDYRVFGAQEGVVQFPRQVTPADLVERQCTPGPCAYRKAMWHELGGYALELARGNGDYDLLIGAAERGIRGIHCGSVFYRYRRGHAGQVSGSYNLRYHETHEIMVRRHPVFFQNRRLRHRFLGLAYRRTALAHMAVGDNRGAGTLAWSAARNGMWRDGSVLMLLVLSKMPTPAFHFVQRWWRRGKRIVGNLLGGAR